MTTDIDFDTGTTFNFYQVTGRGRAVIMRGRFMPYRPIKFGIKQRTSNKWLPGAEESTQTVIGPELDDTSINGFWKDLFVRDGSGAPSLELNGEAVESVADAVKLFEDIVREGQTLEVSFNQYTRRGLMTEFEPTWHNRHDCEWTAKFEWSSTGVPLGIYIAEPPSVRDQVSDMYVAFNDLLDKYDSTDFAFTPSILDRINEVMAGIDDAMLLLENATTAIVDIARTPAAIARNVISACKFIVTRAAALRELVESVPAVYLVEGGGVTADDFTPSRTLEAEVYAREIVRLTNELRREAAVTQQQYVSALNEDVVRVYYARAGEDLRAVAERFLGSPTEWRTLMEFNQLSSTALEANQAVLIPQTSHT